MCHLTIACTGQRRRQAWFLYRDLREYRFVGTDRHSDHHRRETAYDLGLTEDEVRSRWERYFQPLREGRPASPAGE